MRRSGHEYSTCVYTADRIDGRLPASGSCGGASRSINAFARVAEADDRGKAFAVEVQWPSRDPDREPWVAFCLDIKVDARTRPSPACSRYDGPSRGRCTARTDFFLPTTVERVWWMVGRGECEPRLVHDLEQSRGENLGSRPDRFRELTAALDWERLCDEALGTRSPWCASARSCPATRRRAAPRRHRAGTGGRHPAGPGTH